MDISIVLARIVGFLLVVVGLSFFNKKTITAIITESESNRGFLWLNGLFALVLGVIIVTLYDIWSFDWRVVVTIFGWIAIVKGTIITLFPEFLLSLYKKLKSNSFLMLSGVLTVVVGAMLLYVGFNS